MNKEKLIIPAAIIIGCLILGIFLYATEYTKQKGITERLEQKIEQQKLEQERKEIQEYNNKLGLDWCMEKAEKNYWQYMELNGEVQEDGSIYALNSYWDTAEEKKQNAIDNCLEKYS